MLPKIILFLVFMLQTTTALAQCQEGSIFSLRACQLRDEQEINRLEEENRKLDATIAAKKNEANHLRAITHQLELVLIAEQQKERERATAAKMQLLRQIELARPQARRGSFLDFVLCALGSIFIPDNLADLIWNFLPFHTLGLVGKLINAIKLGHDSYKAFNNCSHHLR